MSMPASDDSDQLLQDAVVAETASTSFKIQTTTHDVDVNANPVTTIKTYNYTSATDQQNGYSFLSRTVYTSTSVYVFTVGNTIFMSDQTP